MIPSDSIAIDGDTAWWLATPGQGVADDLQQLRLLERSCDTCDGEPIHMDTGAECHDCSGTGRHTFTIEVDCQECDGSGEHDIGQGCWACQSCDGPLSVHVVDVLPLVAVDHWIEGESCVDTLGNLWFPCWTREDEPAHYLAGHAPIPSAAKPGDWIVQLAIHERNQ